MYGAAEIRDQLRFVAGAIGVALLFMATDLNGEAQSQEAMSWSSEGRVGLDAAVRSDRGSVSTFVGSRPWSRGFGPWARVSYAGWSVTCTLTCPEPRSVWSAEAGLDGELIDWGWGVLTFGVGASVHFWGGSPGDWSPVGLGKLETSWDFRLKPFVQARYERYPIVDGSVMYGIGVSWTP